jgi:hypothetical protein
MKAEQAWQATVGQLQLEMPKPAFDTWYVVQILFLMKMAHLLLVFLMHMPGIGWKAA